MARVKVTNPHSGGFDYISSQRKIQITGYAKNVIVDMADDQVSRWLDQFSKDGLIAEVVKEVAAPAPAAKEEPKTSSTAKSGETSGTSSKTTSSSKK